MAPRSIARHVVQTGTRKRRLQAYGDGGVSTSFGSAQSVNMIQQLYRGRYDRFERYRAYDVMARDSDVGRALDIISEHCSEKDRDNRFFQFDWYSDQATSELSDVLKAHLDQWTKINRLEKKLKYVVRNTLMYGDWFMFRNPHTFELYDIHPSMVKAAIIDRDTLDILGWQIQNFRWNIEDLEVNMPRDSSGSSVGNISGDASGHMTRNIPAIHILHFSMSQGKMATMGTLGANGVTSDLNSPWPFGNSFLDGSFKTFRDRELIEDAAVIHRMQRAPTRLVWYIDTGKMRQDRTKYVIRDFKNEMTQSRIPQSIGGNTNGVESTYNPMSQLEDYYIPVSMDQRGSKVQELQGQAWGEIPELDYYKKKLAASLRVPYAWLLPSSEGGNHPSDSRIGQATQEEIEFSRFCSSIHTLLIETFDQEFKMYCRWRDVNANWADFELRFQPPTDYEASIQRARLIEGANVFNTMANVNYLSKRMLLKTFMGFTDDQILENEQLLDEEQNGKTVSQSAATGAMGGMGGIGDINIDNDMSDDLGNATADMGSVDDMMGGDIGGDMGGDMGAGTEHFVSRAKGGKMLLEDLELPEPKTDIEGFRRVPQDNSIKQNDPIKGRPIATLKMLQRLRMATFNKRLDQQKRLLRLNRLYNPAGGEGDGGMSF